MTQRSFPQIPLKSIRFTFTTEPPIRLPRYPGSVWRGAFGNALKQAVCVVRNTPCALCLLKSACAYSYIFETPPPADTEKMRKYEAVPHPFVFNFRPADARAPDYTVDMILFGRGQRFLPYIIHALERAGRHGLGPGRQTFDLRRADETMPEGESRLIYQEGRLLPHQPARSPSTPALPKQIQLNFHSPVRLKQNQKNIVAESFSFHAFFSALLRRISLISYFHTDTPLDTDFAGLSRRARDVPILSRRLQWYDWSRYSSRQQTEMNMGGLVGAVTLDTEALTEFWPYLWLGQWTHVGKGTSMGMGGYTLSADLPSAGSTV